jgi:hypothetical protein
MTAQCGDRIHYKGEDLSLFATPLESFWDDSHPRPQFGDLTTALSRGYVATWAISDEMLYLDSIWGEVIVDAEGQPIYSRTPLTQQKFSDALTGKRCTVAATVEMFFPKCKGRVAATWFTGRLHIPRGALLNEGHLGWDSVYEEDVMLDLENGRVVRTEVVENRDKRR